MIWDEIFKRQWKRVYLSLCLSVYVCVKHPSSRSMETKFSGRLILKGLRIAKVKIYIF